MTLIVGTPMNESCQNEILSSVSRVPRVTVLLVQVRYYLKQRGLLATIQRIFSFLASRVATLMGFEKKKSHVQAAASVCEVLDLQPGDLVEVKSEDEIRKTLDAEGRHRGLTFTPDMQEYCGKQLRVFKRVQRICLEGKPREEMRRLEHTVILEGAICNGGSRGCDRSCFFFWREAWLKRVK